MGVVVWYSGLTAGFPLMQLDTAEGGLLLGSLQEILLRGGLDG